MSLSTLPTELIENIARRLEYQELCRLSQANQRLNGIITNCNELWHVSYMNNWPRLYNIAYESTLKTPLNELKWKNEVQVRHVLSRQVQSLLKRMSPEFYQEPALSEDAFDCFRELIDPERKEIDTRAIVDELESTLTGTRSTDNLTVKYYATKALTSIKQQLLREEWLKMIEKYGYKTLERTEQPINMANPSEADIRGDLVTGAVLIAQFCQTEVTISEHQVRNQIRAIADRTVLELRVRAPNNELIKTRRGQLLTDSEVSNLKESLLQPRHCRDVLCAMNEVMFLDRINRFEGNRDDYYCATNSYIDKVLETKLAIPITMCILYQAVAALLGVKLYPVNNPGHFLLAFREHPDALELYDQFTFVDPFNDGKLASEPVNIIPTPLHFFNTRELHVPRPLVVFRRMASNLIEVGRQAENSVLGLKILRNSLELMTLINEVCIKHVINHKL